MPDTESTESAKEATGTDEFASGSDPGLLREFWWFLIYNKKWWLTPIVVTFLLMIALAFLTTGPVAPFIYSLF